MCSEFSSSKGAVECELIEFLSSKGCSGRDSSSSITVQL